MYDIAIDNFTWTWVYLAVPIRKFKSQLYTMADTEKPTVAVTSEKAPLPEADLTKYKVRQAII